MITFLWLYLIALAGGGLSGICVAGGRNCFIAKKRYYLRAVLRGMLLVNLVLLGVSLVYGLMLALTPAPHELFAQLQAAGDAALDIYGAYALVVAVTFAFYLVPNLEIRCLTTVALFGPLTLARPLVIVAGTIAATLKVPGWPVVVLYGSAALGMITLNHWLFIYMKKLDGMAWVACEDATR